MRRLTIAVTIAVLALAACNKKKDPDKTPATGSGPVTTGSGSTGSGPVTTGSGSTGSGSAMTGSSAGSATAGTGAGTATAGTGAATGAGTAATLANKAGNCPSAVLGATTAIVDDPAAAGKLVLSITAKNAAATATIRKRVAHLVEVQGAPDAEIKHTGDGTGGGAGMCPVLTTKDVKLAATDTEGGSKVTLEPVNAAALDALRKEVETRVTKTAEWAQTNITGTSTSGGGGGTGGGDGDHGGNHSGKGTGTGKDEPPAPTKI